MANAASFTDAGPSSHCVGAGGAPIVGPMIHQHGFTLAESLVTLGVLGTLLGAAMPTVGDLVQGVRLHAIAGDLHQHLLLARSEAIKRNARVALCKSADGLTCSAAGGWEQGWILFLDSNKSGSREPGEPVLQHLQRLPPGWRITANGPVAYCVSYGPLGLPSSPREPSRAGTFTVHAVPRPMSSRDCRSSSMRRVIARMQKASLDNCF